MGHFFHDVFRQFADVFVAVEGRVTVRQGNDFFVFFAAVFHHDDADRETACHRERHQCFGTQNQHVQRIVVVGQCLWNETVVGRIVGGGIENTIHQQHAGFLVEFVFDLAALRNFDDAVKVLRIDT